MNRFLVLAIVLVFAGSPSAAQRVTCETTLYSHAKMFIAAKAIHQSLLKNMFTVTYLASDRALLQPFALEELLDTDRESLRIVFSEQRESYVMAFTPSKAHIRFRIPPVVAWEHFDIPRSVIARIMNEHPDASADLDYAYAYGTILYSQHRYRPYLQVHGLVKSGDFGRRISLGFYASCHSALAENHRNSKIDVHTPYGWRCFIPVLEGQVHSR